MPAWSNLLFPMQHWLLRQPKWRLAAGIYAVVVTGAMALATLFYRLIEGHVDTGIVMTAFATSTVLSLPLMAFFLSTAYHLLEQEKIAAQSRRESERQRDVLRTLLDASLLIQQKEDLVDLLDGTIQQLRLLFRDHEFGVLIYGRRRRKVRHMVAPGFSPAEQELFLSQGHAMSQGHCEALVAQLSVLPEAVPATHWLLMPLWNRRDQTIGHLVIKGAALSDYLREAVELFRDQLAAGVENHLLRLELLQLANTDGLTGIYNRAYFQKSLLQQQEAKQQIPAMDFSLLIVDINGLKTANDLHGHLVGDEMIIRVAQRLKAICRSEDIVCRIGGDEFAILCPNLRHEPALRLAERLQEQAGERPLTLGNGQTLPITLSIGIASSDETDPEQVMIVADQRMYADKQRFYASQQGAAG
ncbi:MAG: diguanylate cyclase domain-containing protein [Pseudomonadota bacterium]